MEIKKLLDLIEQARASIRASIIERGEDPGPIDALKKRVNEGESLELLAAELKRLTGEPAVSEGVALGRNVVRFLPFSEDSPWSLLIDGLGDELTADEKALLTRFIGNHQLVGSPRERTELRANHKEVLKILLSRSDLEEKNSVGALALKYFLSHLFIGVARALQTVPETGSLVLLDAWILSPEKFRSNGWIFLDQPHSLIPSLDMTGKSNREPLVSHIAIFPAGGHDQTAAVKDQIRDLLAKGTLHSLVPGLEEIVVQNGDSGKGGNGGGSGGRGSGGGGKVISLDERVGSEKNPSSPSPGSRGRPSRSLRLRALRGGKNNIFGPYCVQRNLIMKL